MQWSWAIAQVKVSLSRAKPKCKGKANWKTSYKEKQKKVKTEQCWAIKWVLEQLKKAQGKGKTIQKSSGQEEEEEKEEEKVGTRIRLGLKPWGELKIIYENGLFDFTSFLAWTF